MAKPGCITANWVSLSAFQALTNPLPEKWPSCPRMSTATSKICRDAAHQLGLVVLGEFDSCKDHASTPWRAGVVSCMKDRRFRSLTARAQQTGAHSRLSKEKPRSSSNTWV